MLVCSAQSIQHVQPYLEKRVTIASRTQIQRASVGTAVDEADKMTRSSAAVHLAGGACFTKLFGDALSVQVIFTNFNLSINFIQIQ